MLPGPPFALMTQVCCCLSGPSLHSTWEGNSNRTLAGNWARLTFASQCMMSIASSSQYSTRQLVAEYPAFASGCFDLLQIQGAGAYMARAGQCKMFPFCDLESETMMVQVKDGTSRLSRWTCLATVDAHLVGPDLVLFF